MRDGAHPSRWGSTGIAAVLSLFFLSGFLGCTTLGKTTRKIARDLNPRSATLRIRLALLPIENRTGLEPKILKTQFKKPLSVAIRRNCSAVLLESGTPLFGPDNTLSAFRTANGALNAYLLSKAGRRRGFNAVAAVHVESIKARMDRRGILWFKGSRPLLQAHADAEVFDTLTATKIVSKDFYFETAIDKILYDKIRSGKNFTAPQVRKALQQTAEEMGEAIGEALNDLPWRGYVTRVQGDTVRLSSGKRVGLKTGMVLTVFDPGTVIQGIEGQRFILPGKPKGRIQITAVHPDTAEAVVVSGGPFAAGSAVGIP